MLLTPKKGPSQDWPGVCAALPEPATMSGRKRWATRARASGSMLAM
jgi:hypothetical protein